MSGFFLEFKKRLIERYDGLFNGTVTDDGGGDYSGTSQFAKRWGWYQSLYVLAQGDVRRFNDITELSTHQCLTYLSFEKEKVTLENNEIKKRLKR